MTDLVSYWSFFWFVLPFEARRLQRREEELAFAFCFLFFRFFHFFPMSDSFEWMGRRVIH